MTFTERVLKGTEEMKSVAYEIIDKHEDDSEAKNVAFNMLACAWQMQDVTKGLKDLGFEEYKRKAIQNYVKSNTSEKPV